MTATTRYEKFAKSYLSSEVKDITKRWTVAEFARVMSKSNNTVKAWLAGTRLPDLANLSLICERAEVDEARRKFIMHVAERLHTGGELISNLDQRNMYVVESAERNYGHFVKWDPVLMSTLVQTKAFHMKVLPEPREGSGSRLKHWERKLLRQQNFFGRIGGEVSPTLEIYVTPAIFPALAPLSPQEKDEQIARMIEVDAMPGCEVRVANSPMVLQYAFDSFEGRGVPGAGPNFVYVETLDQSRHVVEPDNVALYDEGRSRLRADSQRIEGFVDGGTHWLAEKHPKQQRF